MIFNTNDVSYETAVCSFSAVNLPSDCIAQSVLGFWLLPPICHHVISAESARFLPLIWYSMSAGCHISGSLPTSSDITDSIKFAVFLSSEIDNLLCSKSVSAGQTTIGVEYSIFKNTVQCTQAWSDKDSKKKHYIIILGQHINPLERQLLLSIITRRWNKRNATIWIIINDKRTTYIEYCIFYNFTLPQYYFQFISLYIYCCKSRKRWANTMDGSVCKKH